MKTSRNGSEYPFMEKAPGGVYLKIRVQPRGRKNQVEGVHGGSLKVRLTAPPVEGEANKALVDFLSKFLGVRKSSVTIASGEKSRDKKVLVKDATPEAIARSLTERFG